MIEPTQKTMRVRGTKQGGIRAVIAAILLLLLTIAGLLVYRPF